MKYGLRLLLILTSLLPLAATAEAIVVVANPGSGVEKLSRTDVVNIFLGRFRQFPTGIAAQPIDLPVAHPARTDFYRLLVDKNPAEINAYWARLVFSGRTQPPIQSESMESTITSALNVPGGITYMERSKVGSRLKIVFEFPP